uniref:hypothetical protein n=1 Tax=Ningiella ruwaisensis TaxID=2364274 RepID=UPI00109FB889|nr:hypothetical protein [Ningiella ruwaisensis]
MISNTVVIFLRDLLPIFILFAYISNMPINTNLFSHFWKKLISVGTVVATLLIYVTTEYISEIFEGRGIELSSAAALIFVWLSLVLITVFTQFLTSGLRALLLGISLVLFTAIQSAEFLIYFGVFAQYSDNLPSILIACILGLGICISFTVLLRFILSELLLSGRSVFFYGLWFAFLAGQVSQVIGLLSQVDIIDDAPALFSLQALISNASEYGHALHALIGYESSPNVRLIGLYLITFLLPLLLKILVDRQDQSAYREGNQK